MKTLALLTALCLLITACSNAEIGNIKDVNPATVYTSYYVNYSEGADSMVTFRGQFTFAGPNGTSLVLNAPAKVELDGYTIAVDSNNMEGAFYEVKKPAGNFNGVHTVAFTNVNGKVYTNHFNFANFTLQPVPGSVDNNGLLLNFSKLNANDSVYIKVEDTSYETRDIDTLLAVKNNVLQLPGSLFSALHGGPLTVNVSSGYDKPLEQATAEGGKILFMYTLAERKTLLKK